MATNNNVDNIFPTSGVTMTGTVAINSTGGGTTTIGSSSAGAFNFASGSNSTYALNDKTFTLTTGTGNINIGTDATAKVISISNSSTSITVFKSASMSISNSNPVITTAGTGGITITNNGGNISFDSNGANACGIATLGAPPTINIGTQAVDIPINIGNSNSTSTLTITSGTGVINIGATGAKTINIGNNTTTTSVLIGNTPTVTGVICYFPFINITTSTANLIPGLYHIINTATVLTTVTLPTISPIGSIITVVGSSTGGWIIAQNSGQNINSTAKSSTVGTLGTVASAGRYDCVQIICTVANTTWSIKSSKGTLTIV